MVYDLAVHTFDLKNPPELNDPRDAETWANLWRPRFVCGARVTLTVKLDDLLAIPRRWAGIAMRKQPLLGFTGRPLLLPLAPIAPLFDGNAHSLEFAIAGYVDATADLDREVDAGVRYVDFVRHRWSAVVDSLPAAFKKQCASEPTSGAWLVNQPGSGEVRLVIAIDTAGTLWTELPEQVRGSIPLVPHRSGLSAWIVATKPADTAALDVTEMVRTARARVANDSGGYAGDFEVVTPEVAS